tara:strand:+ start:468 stop:707 length:240 start_codon:yes stop_codon:yes gene_type:complete
MKKLSINQLINHICCIREAWNISLTFINHNNHKPRKYQIAYGILYQNKSKLMTLREAKEYLEGFDQACHINYKLNEAKK